MTARRLIRLLTPPFDTTDRDPGYIQAYPPGVRENGGQYTHAAAWLGLAYAKIKNGDRAHHVFDMINPIARTSARDAADHYRREPYVLAGDVSGAGARIGRGAGHGIRVRPDGRGSWVCRAFWGSCQWPAVCGWTRACRANGVRRILPLKARRAGSTSR